MFCVICVVNILNICTFSSSIMTSHEQNQPAERHSSKSSNGNTDSQPRHPREIKSNDKKEPSENRRVSVPKDNQPIGTKKANDPEPNSATSPKNSVTGLYSSSSDPVHVPSPDSRPAANIGAIKREVGAVGVRRLTDISAKASSTESPSSNQHLGRDGRSSAAISKSGQSPQTSVNVAAVRSISVSRPSVNNQHVNRQHQSLGHQKGIIFCISILLFCLAVECSFLLDLTWICILSCLVSIYIFCDVLRI